MALVMALSLLPVQALAEDAAVGEPVTEIKQAEQTGEGEEPGDPEEQTGEGEEPGDPEEEQEPGEPEEPVREFVQGEAQLTVSTAAMAAGTAGETTELADIHIALSVGGSLKLLNDVEYSGSMDVAFDLVIDLNGYVLKMNGIKVENGGSLTIIDSDPKRSISSPPTMTACGCGMSKTAQRPSRAASSTAARAAASGHLFTAAACTWWAAAGSPWRAAISWAVRLPPPFKRGAAVCSWLKKARSPCPAAVLRAARRWEAVLMAAAYTMKEP